VRTWRTWKSDLKRSILTANLAAESHASFSSKCNQLGVDNCSFKDVKEAKATLEPLGFKDHQHHQWACVPNTAAAREAYLWMYSFFGLVGDSAPNRANKIQLPGIYTKASIYQIYVNHIVTLYTANEHEVLELRCFESLWQRVFPNVTISMYCQVSGKCFCCHCLYERQENFKCEGDLKKIKKLAIVHKIHIEMQRAAYKHNKDRAQERPDLYMSLIIDGMSQDHCVLPYYGGKHQETATKVKQKIIGAKQHGFSRTFYRLFPHVRSGANTACEVLLHEIERRMDHCKLKKLKFPRHLFLQIDGGPENSSKTFYGLCEYLVRVGIFDQIDVSRLPVGHTHEDIDALFGVLWRAAQGKTLITPQQWRQMAISTFEQS